MSLCPFSKKRSKKKKSKKVVGGVESDYSASSISVSQIDRESESLTIFRPTLCCDNGIGISDLMWPAVGN